MQEVSLLQMTKLLKSAKNSKYAYWPTPAPIKIRYSYFFNELPINPTGPSMNTFPIFDFAVRGSLTVEWRAVVQSPETKKANAPSLRQVWIANDRNIPAFAMWNSRKLSSEEFVIEKGCHWRDEIFGIHIHAHPPERDLLLRASESFNRNNVTFGLKFSAWTTSRGFRRDTRP